MDNFIDNYLHLGDNRIPSIPEVDREECPETSPNITLRTPRVVGVQVERTGIGGPTMIPRTVPMLCNPRTWRESSDSDVWHTTDVALCQTNSVSHWD